MIDERVINKLLTQTPIAFHNIVTKMMLQNNDYEPRYHCRNCLDIGAKVWRDEHGRNWAKQCQCRIALKSDTVEEKVNRKKYKNRLWEKKTVVLNKTDETPEFQEWHP